MPENLADQRFTVLGNNPGAVKCPDCGDPLPSNRVVAWDSTGPWDPTGPSKVLVRCRPCGEKAFGIEPGTATVDARIVDLSMASREHTGLSAVFDALGRVGADVAAILAALTPPEPTLSDTAFAKAKRDRLQRLRAEAEGKASEPPDDVRP